MVKAISTTHYSTKEWTNVKGVTPDGKPAFITAVYGPNEQKDGYIFSQRDGLDSVGRSIATQGDGYYHVTTKEGNEILASLIASNIKLLKMQLAMEQCCAKVCCVATGDLPYTVQQFGEKKVPNYEIVKQLVDARCLASAPTGVETLPTALQRNHKLMRLFYTPSGDWKFPELLCEAAGGNTGYIKEPGENFSSDCFIARRRGQPVNS